MHEDPYRILIADDDASLRVAIRLFLEKAGYEVCEAANGLAALETFTERRPDAVILDIMMPYMDGFETCERMHRIDPDAPILMLSAKNEMVDKRVGFGAGADDYLTKPFDDEELLLRIRVMLRHRERARSNAQPVDRVLAGDLLIDLHHGEVFKRGKKIGLTPKEGRIVEVMAEYPGKVFTRDDLVKAVWGPEYVGTAISIPVYIRKIREKLEDNPAEPIYLQTIWNCGYSFYHTDEV